MSVPCKYFQRGQCKYGVNCKFSHDNQHQQNGFGTYQHQQPKLGTALGFRANQQQQQLSNPFGFGSKNSTQSKGGNSFGNKQQQFKPFENKWSRFSPIANDAAGAPISRQPDNQTQASTHKCTDPESCKRVIAEDLEHEKPFWKLTCYGHCRYASCDIVGDVSYEEMRAAAYDDAKRGLSLESIVKRERSLLNSKLNEFEVLLRSPYVVPSISALSSPYSFPRANANALSPMGPNTAQSSVSSFAQVGPSANVGYGTRPSALLYNAFGQSNLSSNSSQPSRTLEIKNFPSANAGLFRSHLPQQSLGNTFFFNVAGSGNNGIIATHNKLFSALAVTTQNSLSSSGQLPVISNRPNPASNAAGHASTNIQLGNIMQGDSFSMDVSVWSKEKWIPGEIPEEAPPVAFI